MHSLMSLMPLFEGETTGTTVTIDTVGDALGTALSTTSQSVMSVIGDVLPYALGIMGAVLVITIGIKVFKKISGK